MRITTRFIYIFALACFLTSGAILADTWTDVYETNPDVANCSKGLIKETVRTTILNEVNRLRAIHGIPAVTYDMVKEPNTQQGALMCTANNTINHTPPSSWYCYTSDGYNGTENSNLYMLWQMPGSVLPSSVSSITSWMIDSNTPELGHRLAIINPFVKKISFGRVDGTPKASSSNFVTAMALYYRAEYATSIDVDFVAYPYQNYPPEHVDKSYYLCFSAFYDKNQWWNNTNVDISQVQIQVFPEGSSTSLNCHDFGQSKNWGSVGNCLRWKTDGLQNEVKYTVVIKKLLVNGVSKEYTYWFKITSTGTIQPPATPVLVSPADGATKVPYSVALDWNSSIGAVKYKLQLSKSNDFNSNVIDDSTLETIYNYSGLESNTTYYWRVRAVNSAGSSAFSAPFSFKTATFVPPPAAPVLISPENNLANAGIDQTMLWYASKGADDYKLQISKFEDFSTINKEYKTSDTSYEVKGLNYETKYYWRVAASNETGQGSWSEKRNFTTSKEVSEPPAMPVLLYPLNGTNNVGAAITLEWQVATRAQNYYLQVSKNPEFSSFVAEKLITTNTHKLTDLESNTTYYWRIGAYNNVGTSGFCTGWQFTTSSNLLAPEPPVLTEPQNKATKQPTTLTIKWAAQNGATQYHIQVSKTADFSSDIDIDRTVQSNSADISGLANGTVYYWRIATVNAAGGEGPFCASWFFTTAASAPNVPLLYYPENNSTDVPRDPEFKWYSLGAGYVYELMVADTNIFDDPTVSEEYLSDTSYMSNPLLPQKNYWWKVRAYGSGVYGEWSTIWQFRTGLGTHSVETIFEDRASLNNYPNPFGLSTTIKFKVVQPGNVSLKLYDAIGNEVRVLAQGYHESGDYQLLMESTGLPQGVYFYRLVTADRIYTNMLEIIR